MAAARAFCAVSFASSSARACASAIAVRCASCVLINAARSASVALFASADWRSASRANVLAMFLLIASTFSTLRRHSAATFVSASATAARTAEMMSASRRRSASSSRSSISV